MSIEIFNSERYQSAEIDRLLLMPLGQFRFENTWLRVESSLLPSLTHGEIYIVSNERVASELRASNARAVCYGPGELKRIIDLDPGPEDMKAIHAAKAILGGRVIETKRREI